MASDARKRETRAELLALAEQYKKTSQAFKRIGYFDTWTLVVDISGQLDGGIKDWPAHIADPIYAAVERQCIPKPGERVEVIASKCYRDMPDEPAYVTVVVQAFPILVM